jgi:hypothetical protein
MVEKRFAGRGQFDAMSAAAYQLNANFLFEVSDLPAERWLRSVELLLGGDGQTACIGHRDEVAKMTQFHRRLPYLASMGPSLQSLFHADQQSL